MYIKKLVKVFSIILVLSFIQSTFALPEIIETFDLKTYNPKTNGIKEFYCQLRIEGLRDRLVKQYPAIKFSKDVYFELYWMFPDKYDVVVQGIPGNFAEIENNLKALVAARGEFIIPNELGPQVRSYQLKQTNLKRGVKIEAIDPTNTKGINRVELNFDSDGKLDKFKTYSPLGFQESDFDYGKKSWSKNKWVLENVKGKMMQGPQITKTETKIEYSNHAGHGVPERVEIESERVIVVPEKGEEKVEKSSETVILFSEYQINQGIATKHFRK